MTLAKSEIEAKLVAPDREALVRLPADLAALARSVSPATRQAVRDCYLDTRDRWLLRAGAACRVREVNGRAVLTLKSLTPPRGRISCRQETEEPLAAPPAEYPTRVPAPRTAAWLQPLLGRKRLVRLFEVEQDREVWRVRTREGAVLRVSADVSRWRAPGRAAPDQASVEIELIRGGAAAVETFAENLRRRTGFRPGTQSKFQRGLALIGLSVPVFRDDPATELRKKDRFAEAAWRVLQRHLRRLIWNAPGARLGLDPDRLHDLRVAVRRLRSALRWFKGGVPSITARRLRADLRWLAGVTGRMRDLDVFLQRWPERVQQIEPRLRTALKEFEQRLEEDHHRARQAVLTALGSHRFARFLEDATRLLKADPPRAALRTDPGRRLARTVARKRLRRHLKEAVKGGRKLKASSPPETYHQLRIALKRLRYGLEFFTPLFGSASQEVARELVSLQDFLGLHQDATVACRMLEEALGHAAPAESQSQGFSLAISKLLVLYSSEAGEARRKFRAAWKRLDRKKTLRPLLRRLR